MESLPSKAIEEIDENGEASHVRDEQTSGTNEKPSSRLCSSNSQ